MRVGLTPRAFIMDKPTPPNHPTPPPDEKGLLRAGTKQTQEFSGSLGKVVQDENSSRKTSVADVRDWQEGDIYIGRARPTWLLPASLKGIFPDGIKQSIWRNTQMPPNATPEQRAESITAYKARLLKRPELLARLPELKGKRLVCWCAPNACHGDILVELANALPETDPTIRAGSLADDPSSLVKLADVPETDPTPIPPHSYDEATIRAGSLRQLDAEISGWQGERIDALKANDLPKAESLRRKIDAQASVRALIEKPRSERPWLKKAQEEKEWEATLEREHLAAVNAGEVAAEVPTGREWKFSHFERANHTRPIVTDTTLAEVIATIRTDTTLAEVIASLRGLIGKRVVVNGRDVSAYKHNKASRLPAVDFSGHFSTQGHKGENRLTYNGLIVIDFDKLTASQMVELKGKLMADKRLVFLFVSPSGAGYKCGFWTAPVERAEMDWQAVKDERDHAVKCVQLELAKITGLKVDDGGSRLCFLSHDPDAVYWPDAEEWLVLGRSGALPSSDPASGVLALSDTPQVAQAEKVKAVKTKSTKPAPKLTLDEVRSMLAVIVIKPHDRPTWLAVAHSVGNTLTETEAVQVLDEWSDLLNTEARRYADEQGGYARQLAGRDDTCTSATLIHHAKENGWRPPIPAVEVFYDYQRKAFCAKNSDGNWLREGADNLSRWMVAKRIAKDRDQASMICGQAMDTRSVDWSAPLAGYPEGYRTMGDARLLITAGPRLITAQAGEWPTIRSLLFGLFAGDAAAEQFNSFVLWIKHRVQMLENVSWRSGHILCLVGPVGCGKSLVQRLITEMLGGRVASPVAYFAGDASGFNAELFKAEHLAIEDEGSSTDPKSRLRMGDHWKRVAVNQDHRCHGKHQEALTLRPLWSCSVSLNDEGERLLVIPPMTADIVGKVMILKCSSPIDPFPTATDAAKAEYWRRLVSELPAFLAYCQTLAVVVKDTETRDERDERSRFGFVAYRSPEIMAETEGHAPEKELLELIDLICFAGQFPAKIEESLVEWELRLTTDPKYGKRAARLLDWSGALMTYFKRLKGKAGGRVTKRRDEKGRYWQVSREGREDADQ